MKNQPRPEEIVRMAAFVDAGNHLSTSEFFGEDDHCSYWNGGATFGSSETLLALLAPFRRTWMQQEPGNFTRAAKLVEYHSVDAMRRGMAEQQRLLFNEHRRIVADEIGLPYEELIDLWLYTQYSHCQVDRKKGRFTRQDFDLLAAKHGKLCLEYHFRQAVKLLGTHILIFYHESALPEFEEWVTERGVVRPFDERNAFTVSNEASQSCLKARRVPHPLLEEEPSAYRLARILERQHFRPLKSTIEKLFALVPSDASLAAYTYACESILSNATINELLQTAGYLEVQMPPPKDWCSRHYFNDSGYYQKGTVEIYSSKEVVFYDDAKNVLERLLIDLRSELMTNKRKSTFLDVEMRLQKQVRFQQKVAQQKTDKLKANTLEQNVNP